MWESNPLALLGMPWKGTHSPICIIGYISNSMNYFREWRKYYKLCDKIKVNICCLFKILSVEINFLVHKNNVYDKFVDYIVVFKSKLSVEVIILSTYNKLRRMFRRAWDGIEPWILIWSWVCNHYTRWNSIYYYL